MSLYVGDRAVCRFRWNCIPHGHLNIPAVVLIQLTVLMMSIYGEVNSVKKHNYKIWLNDGVY